MIRGYGTALFNLGWRYERGWGTSRNFAEAWRCYFKSAKLGNSDATKRLGPASVEQEAGNAFVPAIPVMPIWPGEFTLPPIETDEIDAANELSQTEASDRH